MLVAPDTGRDPAGCTSTHSASRIPPYVVFVGGTAAIIVDTITCGVGRRRYPRRATVLLVAPYTGRDPTGRTSTYPARRIPPYVVFIRRTAAIIVYTITCGIGRRRYPRRAIVEDAGSPADTRPLGPARAHTTVYVLSYIVFVGRTAAIIVDTITCGVGRRRRPRCAAVLLDPADAGTNTRRCARTHAAIGGPGHVIVIGNTATIVIDAVTCGIVCRRRAR